MAQDPGQITAPQLAQLSGLTERRLRELAREGCFPRMKEGRYQLVPTIQGLLHFYRERDQQRALQDCYDSIGACASATGIPVSAIRHAKRLGSVAFKGSRVHLAPLLRWIFEQSERSTPNFEHERAQQVTLQNAKLKVQIRRIKRELIPIEEVARVGAELGSAARTVVARLHRVAPSLAGHSIAAIESKLTEEEAEVLKQLNKIADQMRQWQSASME